jgi:hypothetical protein
MPDAGYSSDPVGHMDIIFRPGWSISAEGFFILYLYGREANEDKQTCRGQIQRKTV